MYRYFTERRSHLPIIQRPPERNSLLRRGLSNCWFVQIAAKLSCSYIFVISFLSNRDTPRSKGSVLCFAGRYRHTVTLPDLLSALKPPSPRILCFLLLSYTLDTLTNSQNKAWSRTKPTNATPRNDEWVTRRATDGNWCLGGTNY
jgi:hypothetical protein